jgi:hypothetical protein
MKKTLPLGLYYEIINIGTVNNTLYRVVSNIPMINNLRSNIDETEDQFIIRITKLVHNEFYVTNITQNV